MSDKQNRPSELRERTDEELLSLTRSLEEDLFKFRVQRYTNQLENTMKIRTTRRTLARVKTILVGRAKGIDKRRAPTPAPEAKE